MITPGAIEAAIRRVRAGKERVELRDAGDRCGGRLVFIGRRIGQNSRFEWYAVYHRDNKRRMTKIGTYPSLSIAAARATFRNDYAPAILAGAEPANPFSRAQHRKGPDASVRALFTAYVAHLKAAGKTSWYEADRILLKRTNNAASALGADRLARSIETETIVSYLAEMHARGAIGMAHCSRAYIRSAFSFGMKAEYSYTRTDAVEVRWMIKFNPAAAIPTDPLALNVGDRFLEPAEFRLFWEWLEAYKSISTSASALQLLMATGQRVGEILGLTDDHYYRAEQMLMWPKTKNGLPHSLPLPAIAIPILDAVPREESRFLFPHRSDPDRSAISTTPQKICDTYLRNYKGTKRFTPRDLRRTWKTLAGRAGLSKEMRDRLQNHYHQDDVSARHYDRYDYMPERRAAMNKWDRYLRKLLNGEFDSDRTPRAMTRNGQASADARVVV
jgi:integrase